MSAFNEAEAAWIDHLLKDTMRARNLWVWEGKLGAMLGSHIDGACRELTWLSQLCGILPTPLSIDFNGIEIVADGRSSDDLVAAWRAESDRRRDAYLASPEYAESQRVAAEKEAKHKIDLAAAEAMSPDAPTWSDPEGWAKACAANSDGYDDGMMEALDLAFEDFAERRENNPSTGINVGGE